MQIDGLKNIAVSEIPRRRGTDVGPLIKALGKGPVSFPMPEVSQSTVRQVISAAVRKHFEGQSGRVMIRDGVVYVELGPRREQQKRAPAKARAKKAG